MNLPNVLTVGRILLVPLIVWLMLVPRYELALVIFVAAGITDLVDGYLARRFEMKTRVGAYLDPLADKALLVSVFVTLGVQGLVEAWLVVLVVSRDIAIVAAVILMHLAGARVRMTPFFISKLNTAVQILYALFVLALLAFKDTHTDWIAYAGWPVAALTIASWAAYLIEWLKAMAAGEDKPSA